MHSPCRCCPNPFLGLRDSQTLKSTESSSFHDFANSTSSTLYPNTQFTNHESLPSLEDSFSNFVKAFPQYSQTHLADQIRAREYYHLALSKHVCLDYVGHGLFSNSQQNASSSSSSSVKSTTPQPQFFDISHKSTSLNSEILYGSRKSELESKIRTRLMGFMNLSETDYTVVFTANQSSAFKLVADSYQFQSNQNLLTVYDHHCEAAEAMIEISKKKGARVASAEFSWPNLRVDSEKLRKTIVSGGCRRRNRGNNNSSKGLFVFPLQSRVTGAGYSYRWMSLARENGWDVLLDTSALGPKEMETLGLSIFAPDFLFCSCFKVFGENPSGFGCLFVKKSSASILNCSDVSSGIGIVSLVPISKPSIGEDYCLLDDGKNSNPMMSSNSSSSSSPQSLFQMLREEGFDENDDVKGKKKAVSFPEIMGSEKTTTVHVESDDSATTSKVNGGSTEMECRGLDHADSLGLIIISCRSRYLINWLVNALTSLKHPNSLSLDGCGCSLVRIYGPKIKFRRGPAVAFNLYDWKGQKIDPPLVQKLADRNNISLDYAYLKNIRFSDKETKKSEFKFEFEGTFAKREKENLNLPSEVCVLTVAIGFLTNFEDIYRLWAFVSRFLDADFVEKERWRYTALNQKTVEV